MAQTGKPEAVKVARPVWRGGKTARSYLSLPAEDFDVAEAVSDDDFLTWAAGAGIGFDPRYPGTDGLSLLSPRESSRF